MAEYLVDENFIREFERIKRKVDGASGTGLRNTPQALSFSNPTQSPPPAAPAGAQSPLIELRVAGFSSPVALGGTYYWGYVQKRKAAALSPTSATFVIATFWEDDGGLVLIENLAEYGLASSHVLFTGSIVLGKDAKETATVSGTDYDVYRTHGYTLACS